MNYKKCMSHEENTVTEAEGNLLVVITHFNLSQFCIFPPSLTATLIHLYI
jgi:hypothetical protein